MRTLHLATVLTLAAAAAAQSCGTLAISGGAAGSTLSIGVTGVPNGSYVILGISENTGSTTVNVGPLGLNLTLGLAVPILPLPIGRADGNGAITRSFDVPAGLLQQYPLQGQAVATTLSIFPFSFSACASNVVGFTIG